MKAIDRADVKPSCLLPMGSFSFKESVLTVTVLNDKFPSLDRKSDTVSCINEPVNSLI